MLNNELKILNVHVFKIKYPSINVKLCEAKLIVFFYLFKIKTVCGDAVHNTADSREE